MNPVDDFLQEKTAFFGSMRSAFGNAARQVPTAIAGGLALGGAGAVVGGVGVGASHLWNAATKAQDFRSMLTQNADLAEHHDQKLVNQAFTTLRTFNPDFSKDPLVSGSFVRRIVDSPMGAGGIISEAISARGKGNAPISDMMMHGMEAGVKIKDHREELQKDLKHQKAIEKMRSGYRAQADQADFGRQKALKGLDHTNRLTSLNSQEHSRFQNALKLEKFRHALRPDLDEQLELERSKHMLKAVASGNDDALERLSTTKRI